MLEKNIILFKILVSYRMICTRYVIINRMFESRDFQYVEL